MDEYKTLDKKKDGLRILKLLEYESTKDGQIDLMKSKLEAKYGKKQMQDFYKSLPKAATPLEEEPNFYFVPSIQGMRKAGDKPVRYQWILNEPTQGNNKGGLAKKTKGFKHGGLAGTGHNDMRKGGLFK